MAAIEAMHSPINGLQASGTSETYIQQIRQMFVCVFFVAMFDLILDRSQAAGLAHPKRSVGMSGDSFANL